ncbi:MAG: hypothetical protein LBR28_06805 [Bacteroidales bacterium]|jgi:hypothetical protein|nr:hypothetical protein [Bacteroidales bacterium]
MRSFKFIVVVFIISVFCFEKTAAQVENKENYSVGTTYDYRYLSTGLSFSLSFFCFPGAGQMYNGEFFKGLMYLGGWAGSLMLFSRSAYEISRYVDYGDGRQHKSRDIVAATGMIVGLAGAIGFWVASWINAPKAAQKINVSHGFLTWDVGKRTNLTLSPDIKYYNNILPNQDVSTTFGLKLSAVF